MYYNTEQAKHEDEIAFICMTEKIAPEYIERIMKYSNMSNYDDISKTEFKFLVQYMPHFIKCFYKVFEDANLERRNSRSFSSQSLRPDYRKKYFERIRNVITTIVKNIEESENEELIEFIEENLEEDYVDHEQISLSLNLNKLSLGGDDTTTANSSKSSVIYRPSKVKNTINTRNYVSYKFSRIWKIYQNTVVKSRAIRINIDREHNEFAKFIYDQLTNLELDDAVGISFESFINNVISFIYKCEKASWTVYIIIFMLRIKAMILTIANKHFKQGSSQLITNRVLNNMDTTRNISMLFSILCSSNENDHLYSTEVFGMTLYFVNKIMIMTPETMQKKFYEFFKNDTSSENFFKQCHDFISIHLDKLDKGMINEQYLGKKHTDELTQYSYLIDKNLEKQIVSAMSLL